MHIAISVSITGGETEPFKYQISFAGEYTLPLAASALRLMQDHLAKSIRDAREAAVKLGEPAVAAFDFAFEEAGKRADAWKPLNSPPDSSPSP